MESYNSLAKYFAQLAEDYTRMAREWSNVKEPNRHDYYMALALTSKAEVYKEQSYHFASKAYQWEKQQEESK